MHSARPVIYGDIAVLLNNSMPTPYPRQYTDREVVRNSKQDGITNGNTPMKFIVENFASTTCRASSLTSEINDASRLNGAAREITMCCKTCSDVRRI